MIKKVSWVVLILVAVLLILNWQTLTYGFQQAKGQLSITFNTRDVDEVLEDSLVADSTKQKIKIINKKTKGPEYLMNFTSVLVELKFSVESSSSMMF